MHRVEPKVFLIGEPTLNRAGLQEYLDHLGIPDWASDAQTDADMIVEIDGRLCYRSFEPGMNANVKKVREHNVDYLSNIIKSRHGAVLEHVTFNFIFADVSRVLTHELVRHRVGVAYSQESLRYVRLTDLGLWLPDVIQNDPVAVAMFEETFQHLEGLQLKLAEHFKLDDAGVNFEFKKEVTSAMRRIAPIGLATSISCSLNARSLRWLIELRTAPTAEEEIRIVFGMVAELMIARYPHLFGDFKPVMVKGHNQYIPEYSKI